MQLEENAAELLAESVGNDIRQVLNCLQMWGQRSDSVSYTDMKEGISKVRKDDILRVSNFDATRTILDGREPLRKRCAAATRCRRGRNRSSDRRALLAVAPGRMLSSSITDWFHYLCRRTTSSPTRPRGPTKTRIPSVPPRRP